MVGSGATTPLAIGSTVKPWGKISAIRTEGGELGERYYFLIDKHGTISFMPAFIVETAARESA